MRTDNIQRKKFNIHIKPKTNTSYSGFQALAFPQLSLFDSLHTGVAHAGHVSDRLMKAPLYERCAAINGKEQIGLCRGAFVSSLRAIQIDYRYIISSCASDSSHSDIECDLVVAATRLSYFIWRIELY
jgi:hypothetical protein